MKLFVDDERNPPDNTWLISRGAEAAIEMINWAILTSQDFETLSLDHDLGENVPSGYDVAAWLEKEVIVNGRVPPRTLKVHSQNPVGRKRILQAFMAIRKFCEEHDRFVPMVEMT